MRDEELVESILGRIMRKAPVVEYNIGGIMRNMATVE